MTRLATTTREGSGATSTLDVAGAERVCMACVRLQTVPHRRTRRQHVLAIGRSNFDAGQDPADVGRSTAQRREDVGDVADARVSGVRHRLTEFGRRDSQGDLERRSLAAAAAVARTRAGASRVRLAPGDGARRAASRRANCATRSGSLPASMSACVSGGDTRGIEGRPKWR